MGQLDELNEAWRLAFDEAWTSFQAGNFGIGAVLVDPADGRFVAAGRKSCGAEEPRRSDAVGEHDRTR